MAHSDSDQRWGDHGLIVWSPQNIIHETSETKTTSILLWATESSWVA
jgi:hypothetical protein